MKTNRKNSSGASSAHEWKTFFSKRSNVAEFIITLLVLSIVLFLMSNFLQFIEEREGVAFTDPILRLFKPVDVTWFSFILIYAALIICIAHLSNKPGLLLVAFKTYIFLVIFRMTGMYLLPLEPPAAMIALHDPFVQFFGGGEVLTKDLFFSGHTSTMFILFLVVESKKYKYIFLAATFLVGLCVIIQHVHYTVDVFAAPFFAYCSYRIAKVLKYKTSPYNSL